MILFRHYYFVFPFLTLASVAGRNSRVFKFSLWNEPEHLDKEDFSSYPRQALAASWSSADETWHGR